MAKKRWDRQSDEESKQEYKEMQEAKKEVARARRKAYDELYEGLETTEGDNTLYQLARQRHQAGKDVQHVRMMKDKDGNVTTYEESVLKEREIEREGERESVRESERERDRDRAR